VNENASQSGSNAALDRKTPISVTDAAEEVSFRRLPCEAKSNRDRNEFRVRRLRKFILDFVITHRLIV
jgi:hypothetical protein